MQFYVANFLSACRVCVRMNISLHVVTNRAQLQLITPHYERDLTELAFNINPWTASVTPESLDTFFDHGGVLALAWDNDFHRIVSVASIAYVYKFNGCSARLEHVSTLAGHQGRGLGKRIVKSLIAHVIGEGKAKFIDLTCEPNRVVANALYEGLGFEIRQTNPRRLKLQSGPKRS